MKMPMPIHETQEANMGPRNQFADEVSSIWS